MKLNTLLNFLRGVPETAPMKFEVRHPGIKGLPGQPVEIDHLQICWADGPSVKIVLKVQRAE